MSKGSRDRTKDRESFGKTMDRIRRNEARKRKQAAKAAAEKNKEKE